MAFARRVITKTLDLLNLQRHNDNFADIETDLTEHRGRLNTVETEQSAQSERIDNIVASGGESNIEIVDARQPATGPAYPILGDRLNAVDEQLADIVTDLHLTEGVDNTAAVQAALDKKGWVRVVSPGVFPVGKLVIDSDTVFEVLPGVTLKKKNGLDHHILVNKGHITGVRNKNITIRGGIWDLNKAGNPGAAGDMSVDPQSNPGLGIVLRGVDNLTIESITDIGNEWKYAFLITDIDNGIFRKINITNESDGLHFQPPLKNITIEDISGVTHDDLISFTMGDYPRYSLGQTGNVENVFVRNVYGGETTDELIKMVGSGIDGNSVFKNMRFENLSGFSTIVPVCILKEDQAVSNPCLLNTKLENVSFENINVVVPSGGQYFLVGAASGDITIKKLRVDLSITNKGVVFQRCNLEKAIIDDVIVKDANAAFTMSSIVRVDNTTEVIRQLIIKDSNLINRSDTAGNIVYVTGTGVKDIFVSNVKSSSIANFLLLDGVNTEGIGVHVSNSKITCGIFVVGTVKVSIFLATSEIVPITRTVHFGSDAANVRINSVNSEMALVTNTKPAGSVLSATGDVKTAIALTNLTPLFGDRVLYDNVSLPREKGWYFYNGSAWERLNNNLINGEYNVTVGTIPANSTVEFDVTITGLSYNKTVIPIPQFTVPNGVMFIAYNKNSDLVRLRLSNVTGSPITLTGAQVAWVFKTMN
ncbi:hypothetical protein [Paenibacillus sp. DMB5]|uniref:hypothetical protein n=1 Tax=Paenibacillus sp. DMB5 TaxID=1780103 RepID=UPI00076DCC8D|nr:hypothetical protein [Paenibacillus sp. DMB5]KUP22418.1 hypothetical protein AWJ19_27770 [Paenibacillus sp. DMB5]